jgi:uncharacterized protein YndB with AHSA1/START domain
VEIGASVLINRPIREVFDYAVNPKHWSAWILSASALKWISSGPLEVGAMIVQMGQHRAAADGVTWEVTQYEPPRVLACHRIPDPRVTIRQVFESVGHDTRITIYIDEGSAGPFAAESEAEYSIAACLAAGLERLKALLAEQDDLSGSPPSRRSALAEDRHCRQPDKETR